MSQPVTLSEDAAPPSNTRGASWRRLALVAIVVGAAYAAARRTGLLNLEIETAGAWLQSAGPLGLAIFLIGFAFAGIIQLPGMLFVMAGAWAYGPTVGFVAGYLGAVVNCLVSFLFIRKVGGQPFAQLRWGWARRMLRGLDAHPIRTVVLLRTLLWLAPPLSCVLAMTSVSSRDYAIGTLVGLVVPVSVLVLFVNASVAWLF